MQTQNKTALSKKTKGSILYRWEDETQNMSVIYPRSLGHATTETWTRISRTLCDTPVSALLLFICSFWVHPSTALPSSPSISNASCGKINCGSLWRNLDLRGFKLLPRKDAKTSQCCSLGTQQWRQTQLGSLRGGSAPPVAAHRVGAVILGHLLPESTVLSWRTQTSEVV